MVKAKKSLGQHFLNDQNIARKIVALLSLKVNNNVVEVGPGTGILTRFLTEFEKINLKLIEIDSESVNYLNQSIPDTNIEIIEANFLKTDLTKLFAAPFALIGNLPYNISSQIFFKVLENRDQINEVVCMIQKEVAERIASSHGNKSYGILSVLLQTFYNIEYCFTVNEHVFTPPPKVKSAVIKLNRNNTTNLKCDEKLFFQVVKQAFNQRRKTLRNSLKSILVNLPAGQDIFGKRPEQLTVRDFESLSVLIEEMKSNNSSMI